MKKKENPENEIQKPKILLDPWQQEVIDWPENCAICSGRQTGKSTVVAIKAAEFVIKNKNKQVLIISVTEDQAKELLLKAVLYIQDNYPSWIKRPYQKNILKDLIRLNNGSIIRTKAVGSGGVSVRGFTIDMLIADEAAFMPEEVWSAVTPMLATTGGKIILLSTPFGRRGYFYRSYSQPELGFKTWYINAVQNAEDRPISEIWTQFRKDSLREYIKSEQIRMTENQFRQEYLGQFVDELNQWFEDYELKQTMLQEKVPVDFSDKTRDYCLGVDIGRMGGDETVYTIFERKYELLIWRDTIIWKEAKLDQIAYKVVELDKLWNFKRIYLDNGGIGIGVYDMLVGMAGFGKKRVIGVNNAEVVIEYLPDGREKKRKWMKEEIYTNLKVLMQQKKILLPADNKTWLSLKGVQYEYVNQRKGVMLKIDSPDHSTSHIVEAIVRAALFGKEKVNKYHISYI